MGGVTWEGRRSTEATGGSTQNGRIQAVETQRQAAEATQRHRQSAGSRGSTEAQAKAAKAAQYRGTRTGGTGSNGNTDTETETRGRDTEATQGDRGRGTAVRSNGSIQDTETRMAPLPFHIKLCVDVTASVEQLEQLLL